MTRRTPPFRADHVGSLKRPESLQRARERLVGPQTADANLGAHDNAELRALEDAAIKDVVRLQEDIGLQSVTDGEFRRRTWWTDFMLGFDGVKENTGVDAPIVFKDAAGNRRALPSVAVGGKIGWRKSVVRPGFEFLRRQTSRTAKLTIPAPMEMHYLVGGRSGVPRSAYPALDAFWADVAAAYRAEVADLAKAGCTYLQLDDVAFAFLCDVTRQAELQRWGDDPRTLVHAYVELFNQCVRDRPKGMAIALHVCRGNASAHWGAQGGYDPVAEALFNGLDVDGFFLEYDSPRAGGFAPLRFLPKSKVVVLGLVTSKSPEMESKDALKRRIDEAARYADLDRLCLSPQCGFASNYIGNPVTIEDQRKKLALVVDVAREVWG